MMNSGVSDRECARDADLVARVCAGAKSLFHELIAPYRRVEEAVQRTLKAYLHLAELKEPARFKPWLLRIIVNEARMHRRHSRSGLYESITEVDERETSYPRQFADWHDLPDEALEHEELRQAVRKAVENLPESYREVYLLADGKKVRHAMIAEHWE
jgi:RNA polymerase sigma-70 factor (ECF subfamily)